MHSLHLMKSALIVIVICGLFKGYFLQTQDLSAEIMVFKDLLIAIQCKKLSKV